MDDPWVQSIGGSLIAALILAVAAFALRRVREALFSISVSTVIFTFGSILEPATKYVVEGQQDVRLTFLLNDCIRQLSLPLFFTTLLANGLVPGVITGLFILRAKSFRQRIIHGAIWSILSLILSDAMVYYLIIKNNSPIASLMASWSNIYFSMICDLFGGAVAGVIIGSLLHLYMEGTHGRATHFKSGDGSPSIR
jgi:hypothetical protein